MEKRKTVKMITFAGFYNRAWQTFSVEYQLVCILVFVTILGLKVNVTSRQLCHYNRSSRRQHVNKWAWLCSNKTLFIDTEM